MYTSGASGDEAKARLDAIDRESKAYMKNAEKRCRKIRSHRTLPNGYGDYRRTSLFLASCRAKVGIEATSVELLTGRG